MTERHLPLRGFVAALAEAQAALVARGLGEAERWVLPQGRVTIEGDLALGAPGRLLTLTGRGTVLVLPPGARLAAEAARLWVEGLTLDLSGADAAVGLRLQAELSLRASGIRMAGLIAAGAVTGLDVASPDIALSDITVTGLSGDRVVGIRLGGGGRARAANLVVAQLTGAEVTGIEARAPNAIELTGAHVTALSSTGPAAGITVETGTLVAQDLAADGLNAAGPARGIDVVARTEARIEAATVRNMRGAGQPGLPFDDLAGDGALGLRVDAPAGSAARITTADLRADTGRDVALRLAPGIGVEDVTIGRALDGTDLLASLLAAQAELAASPPGTGGDWRLPPGSHHLDAGLSLGAPQRHLAIRGARAGTQLRFSDSGGGAVAGDLVAVEVVGERLELHALTLEASATGQLTVLRARAEAEARLTGLAVGPLTAASLPGAVTVDAPVVVLHDLDLGGHRATAGDLTALAATAETISATSLRLAGLDATARARGLDLDAGQSLHLAAIAVSDVEGHDAEAVHARLDGATPGALSAIDLRISEVGTAADAGLACGAALFVRGDVELRALGITGVRGSRALGGIVAATGTVDLLAASIGDIFGRGAGAAALRVIGAPMEARDDGSPGIALRDVAIDAVRGAAPSGQGRPPDSWLAGAEALAETFVADGLAALPAPGAPGHAEEIVGLSVTAPVPDSTSWLGGRDPASVIVEDGIFRRISGTALQLDTALRDVGIAGCLGWTGTDAAWIDAERVTFANNTFDRFARGLFLNQSELTAVNSLVTRVTDGPGLAVGPGGALSGGAVYATLGSAPYAPEPAPLPYLDPGPATPVPPSVVAGSLAPETATDHTLSPESGLHETAEPVAGAPADAPLYVGALPPLAADQCCRLVDPDPLPPDPPQPALQPSPFADYRARDARAFRQMMLARADVVMPDWTARTQADIGTMLMELLAAELDLIAYRQEEAAANAYLATSTQRRALEDMARLVDYVPDPGASATAMLEFAVRDPARLGLAAEFAAGETLTIPAGTLAVNPDLESRALVFATEADLALDPLLARIELADESPVATGALSARLKGDLAPRLAGRWLVLMGLDETGAALPPHVLRVVRADDATDATQITWDPRRPAPATYAPERSWLLGNVVPAHHGVPLAPDGGDEADALAAWRAVLRMDLPPLAGRLRDVALPIGPISRHGRGWPFPNLAPASPLPQVAVSLDGAPLPVVDDLAADPGALPAVALRPTREGQPGLTLVNAADGGRLDISLSVGLGAHGNVGRAALARVLAFGPGAQIDALLPDRADRLDVLTGTIAVTNPLPATGGRDPEGLESIRAAAPLAHRRALSAVAPTDYERLLEDMDIVAATRATVLDRGLGRTIRVTALLRDEDTLGFDELGDAREAERLRRWALVRHRLDEIRLIGFDVELVPPDFVPLDIDLAVDVASWANADTVRRAVEAALRNDGGLFDPDIRGLGRDVTPDAIQRSVLAVEGVEAVRLLRLRRLGTGAEDFARAPQMPVAAGEVAILRHPHGLGDGLLTVTTCGGLP